MADGVSQRARLFKLLNQRKEAKRKLLGPKRRASSRNWYPELTGEHKRAIGRHKRRGYVGERTVGMWRQIAVTIQNKTKRTNSVSVLANTKLVRRVGVGSDREERIRSFPAHLPTFPLMNAMRDIFGISLDKAIWICKKVIKTCAENRGIARETIVRDVLRNRSLARFQEIPLSPNRTYVIYLSAATIKQINKAYSQSQEPPTLDQIMEIAEIYGYERILHSMI